MVTLRTAGWYYDIHDFINDNGITAPGSGLASNCLYNIEHVNLYGIELEASFKPNERFHATASYIYQEYDVEDNSFEKDWTYYLPALLPKHKIKLLARCNLWQDGWLQFSGRYTGERDAQKGEKLDDYITVDMGLEQKFKFGGMEYTASLFVGNLTGTDYQEQSGYEMPKHVWGFQIGAKY